MGPWVSILLQVLPQVVAQLQQHAAANPQVLVPSNQMQLPSPLPAAPLNPLGWPSPLPPEVADEQPKDSTDVLFARPKPSGNPGIRLLQTALVAAGQQVGVDGVSGPETEKALAAVVQHIMSRVG